MAENSGEIAPERRKTPREKCPVKRTVLAQIEPEGGTRVQLHLHLVDIGESGLRVNLDRAFPEESELSLSFPLLPFGQQLEGDLEGRFRVVWTRDLHGGTYVHGLELLDPTPQTRAAVESLLTQCLEVRHDVDETFLREPVDAKLQLDPNSTVMVAVRKLSTGGLTFPYRESFEKGHCFTVRLLLEPGTAESEVSVRWCRARSDGNYDIACDFVRPSESVVGLVSLHLLRAQ